MRVTPALLAFNRGLLSPLGLARMDLAQLQLSAEEQTNWMPRALGSMMLRPGFEYLGPVRNHAAAVTIPFVFEVDDQARLECTPGYMRPWIDDAVLTRPPVATRLLNPDFSVGLTYWTAADEGAAASTWAAGELRLKGDGVNPARRRQAATVALGEIGLEHAVRIEVRRGPVILKVGTGEGLDDLIGATALAPGWHSLSFTASAADVHVEVSHSGDFTVALARVDIEGGGPMDVPTPYAAADLAKLRWTQSRDVIFLACDGYQQRRIERRGPRSWSVVRYEADDGPFRDENLGRTTLQASALSGDVTLTASADVFQAGHVGALFQLTSSGQRVAVTAALPDPAADVFSGSIRVTGVGQTRAFTATRAGGADHVATLQRSVGVEGDWEDVQTIPVGAGTTIDDGLDNQIIFYRIGVKAAGFGADGPVDLSLSFARGAIDGVARITSVFGPRLAAAVALKPFGETEPTEIWAEGEWSDARGWPTATALFQGRLWWAGRGRLWGSVSDAFASFDAGFDGDAGPIAKTITDGPSDVISWIAVGQRLTLGAVGGALEARSSSLDEPLTPTNCHLKRFATTGVASMPAVVIDDRVLFVERAGQEVMEASLGDRAVMQTLRLTALVPELGGGGFRKLAVQHQPDVRVHALRADGTAACLITDPAENVRCWIEIETDGEIEDVTVMPSALEDAVYYTIKRTIGGQTRRYHERWAPESACRGGTVNRLADSHVCYAGPATATVSGLAHLEGKPVVIWADGAARASAVVAGGAVAISGAPATSATVGLGYRARYRSVKLAHGAQKGTALMQPKRINRLSFILADVHASGLRFGPSYEALTPLPALPAFKPIDPDKVHRHYDFDGAQFPGVWTTDARVCLEAAAPKPVTVLAMAVDLETVER